MSLSWSVHFCQDDEAGGASPALPEVEDDDAAGVAAMAMVARLKRGEEIARKKKAKSSGNSPSSQGGGKILEYLGTGWPLHAAFPCLNIGDPQRADPKSTDESDRAGNLTTDGAG